MKREDFLKVSALGIGAFGVGALVGKAAMSDSLHRCANLRSSVQEVEIDKLQNTLRSQNVYL